MLCTKARGGFVAVHLHPKFSRSTANAAYVLGGLL